MASLYNLEPQPTAKVVLQTTSGDLSFELFAKQTPLASRNFLQHCIDGYYNNTIFHRLVPGFIVQGGDPTGSGSGGISAINDGDAFQDEFHSRLKYNRRGLLGMANEGTDSNSSQFFVTLGATPELQGKNTLFGRIEGDTIYNLMKMAEAELIEGEGSERPLYPTRVIGAEVLVNPFDDMVARVREAPRSKADDGKKVVKKRKKPAAKNALSFADDEDNGETVAPVLKKSKANPRLVTVEEGDREPKATKDRPKSMPMEKVREALSDPEVAQEITKPVIPPPKVSKPQPDPGGDDDDGDEDEDEETSETAKERKRREILEKTNAEIAATKASMRRNVDLTSDRAEDRPKSALEAMIPSSSTRGRKRGKAADEPGAMDSFKAFKNRLEGMADGNSDNHTAVPSANGHGNTTVTDRTAKPGSNEPENDEAELCDLHFIANCQSCRSWDEEKPDGDANADGDDDLGWMAHTLRFTKDTLGKDLEWKKKMEEIEVIDPREKARAIKDERRKHREEGKR